MTHTTRHYKRRTQPLSGTIARHTARLDHASALAVSYAQAWLKDGPGQLGLTVHQSGVIRRALLLYMRHLNGTYTDPAGEAIAVRLACHASSPDPIARNAAHARLGALEGAVAFPTYSYVLTGGRAVCDDPGALGRVRKADIDMADRVAR